MKMQHKTERERWGVPMRSRFHRRFECSQSTAGKSSLLHIGVQSAEMVLKIPRKTEERLEVKLALPEGNVGDTVVSLQQSCCLHSQLYRRCVSVCVSWGRGQTSMR